MRMRFFGRCTPPLFRKAANTNYGQLGDRAGSFQQRLNEYSCADGISYVPNIQPLNIFVLDREFVNLRIYASIPSKDFLSIGIGSAQSTGGRGARSAGGQFVPSPNGCRLSPAQPCLAQRGRSSYAFVVGVSAVRRAKRRYQECSNPSPAPPRKKEVTFEAPHTLTRPGYGMRKQPPTPVFTPDGVQR